MRYRHNLVVTAKTDNGYEVVIKAHPEDEEGDDYGWDVFLDGEWVYNDFDLWQAVIEGMSNLQEEAFYEEEKK